VQVALLSNNPGLIAFLPHAELTNWQNILLHSCQGDSPSGSQFLSGLYHAWFAMLAVSFLAFSLTQRWR
jgi:hypothetical protein